MSPDPYLLVFALSFLGCVLSTPVVRRLAVAAGAIDRPDQFRRVHKGATPRLGGVGLAIGVAGGLGVLILVALPAWPGLSEWAARFGAVALAGAVVLLVGAWDDTIGLGPRAKLLGQTAAVVILYAGGIRIGSVAFFNFELTLSLPIDLEIAGRLVTLDPIGFLITMLWFLACMNIWNLIDGLDGLASGVGLLVSGTMMLVAVSLSNYGSALMAASLAGGLAGFLLYNWHPATIFLGDSGSLLIGLLIGVVGVQGSMKGTMAVSILLPILAMGLPISDTALAIFRRWVRQLPLTAADRRHVHHVLIGLGLNPRQAAIFLYCFTAFLCGVVLLGVAAHSDVLAMILGISGCLAFVLILYSRRDELSELRSDLAARTARRRSERRAAHATWEAIQRIELGEEPKPVLEIVAEVARALGCDAIELSYHRPGFETVRVWSSQVETDSAAEALSALSARFRLYGAGGSSLIAELRLLDASVTESDVLFRCLRRLGLAATERLGRLPSAEEIRIDIPLEAAKAPTPDHGRSATDRLKSDVSFDAGQLEVTGLGSITPTGREGADSWIG